MENEAWSKIQLDGNLELKNLMVFYTLNLKTNLEHLLESILYILYHFKAWEVSSPTLQTVCKSKLKWRSYGHLKTIAPSWRVILKWFRNSTYEFKIHFKVTPILNSPTATLMFCLLYLGNCIYSTYEFEIHFDMTPISNSPTVILMFRLLYLGYCI